MSKAVSDRADPPESDASDGPGDASRLRDLMQELVRGFGLLAANQTPCGQPVSPSHAHALMTLVERKRLAQATSQTELGASLGIDKSNVARLCGRMEAAGHVLQKRAPGDGRSRVLQLTAKGAALAARIEAASHARFSALLASVPTPKRRSLLDCLAVLNAAVHTLRTTEETSP